jgi:cytochrome c-type biogenesis protein CcmH
LLKHFLVLLCLTFLAPVFAAEVTEDPLERQTLAIAKDLRCAVCQSQPVSESNSDLARDMRAIIREQLEAGKSREEIMEYFVARYGNYVLMKPPYDQSGTLLWLAPVLLLVAMAIGGWLFLRNRKDVELPPVAALSEEDRARVKAAEEAARKEDEEEK